MKIDHIGMYCKDLQKIADFYCKYFNGTLSQPPYHNPKKNFTSHLITFESGARLEIMHQPTIPEVKEEPKSQFIGYILILLILLLTILLCMKILFYFNSNSYLIFNFNNNKILYFEH